MTLRELLKDGERKLQEAQIPEASIDAWYLLEYVTGMNKQQYFLSMGENASDEVTEQYKNLIEKRCEHIPLQYLTGTQDFMGLTFEVNPSVLIPRQDTEILVEEVRKQLRPKDRILDLCTGSGCILISLLAWGVKKHAGDGLCGLQDNLTGVGADISEAALSIAQRNASLHNIEAQWICGDLFENITGSFQVIVSNPPYIPSREIPGLMPEVCQHEPVGALDGREDGLYFYDRITREAPEYLSPGGWLFFEIGCEQAEAVTGMMKAAGFCDVKVTKDLCGLDRVVSGHL